MLSPGGVAASWVRNDLCTEYGFNDGKDHSTVSIDPTNPAVTCTWLAANYKRRDDLKDTAVDTYGGMCCGGGKPSIPNDLCTEYGFNDGKDHSAVNIDPTSPISTCGWLAANYKQRDDLKDTALKIQLSRCHLSSTCTAAAVHRNVRLLRSCQTHWARMPSSRSGLRATCTNGGLAALSATRRRNRSKQLRRTYTEQTTSPSSLHASMHPCIHASVHPCIHAPQQSISPFLLALADTASFVALKVFPSQTWWRT